MQSDWGETHTVIGGDRRKRLQDLLLPLTDLVGVDTVFTGNLGRRLFLLHRFQTDPGLECRIVTPPHVVHGT